MSRKKTIIAFIVTLFTLVVGCSRNHYKNALSKPYVIHGILYRPIHTTTYKRIGIASWYGKRFAGKKTADGEIFDMKLLTAAHPTLPIPSFARVTNLDNDRSIVVRVNDRGPFSKHRIIDLSPAAAEQLGYKEQGTARVLVEYLGKAD